MFLQEDSFLSLATLSPRRGPRRASQSGQIDATDHVHRLTRDPVYRWAGFRNAGEELGSHVGEDPGSTG